MSNLGPIDVRTIVVQLVFMTFGATVMVGFLARRAHDPHAVDSWARGHALTVTERNRALITWFVRFNIVLRVAGGVSGVFVGSTFDAAFGVRSSAGIGFWIWIVLGWLAGATWAERRLPRPPSATASASLVPRRTGDYLPVGLQVAPACSAVLVAAGSLAGTLLTWPSEPQLGPPSDATLIAFAGCAMTVALATLVTVRTTVGRRQPVMHPDLVAADDAIRSSTAHHLAGGGTAVVLAIGVHVASAVTGPYRLPYGIRGWLPGTLLIAAWFSWRYFAFRGWLVRRPRVSAPASKEPTPGASA